MIEFNTVRVRIWHCEFRLVGIAFEVECEKIMPILEDKCGPGRTRPAFHLATKSKFSTVNVVCFFHFFCHFVFIY